MVLQSETHMYVTRIGDAIRLILLQPGGEAYEVLTPIEAMELAAELVKLAMPEATKEEETNAITA